MLKLLPIMLLRIARKVTHYANIIPNMPTKHNFKGKDCFIRVYSHLGIHITNCFIRMFHKVIVPLELITSKFKWLRFTAILK